jgi:competence protein ComEA
VPNQGEPPPTLDRPRLPSAPDGIGAAIATVRGRMSTAAIFVAVAAIAAVAWWLSRPDLGETAPIDDRLPLASPSPLAHVAPPPGVTVQPVGAGAEPTEPVEIVVHVVGAVSRPGIYTVPADARVADVIDAAGGPTSAADLERLNLAAAAADGSQIWVPVVGEEAPVAVAPLASGGGASTGQAGDGSEAAALISINTATAVELEELPGIGPTLAGAIVAFREEQGPFVSIDSLLDVPGIGPAKLDQLAPLVTL